MLSGVQAIAVQPRILAAARGRAVNAPVGQTMLALLTQAWGYVRKTGMKNTGINVAMYLPDDEPGVAIEAGVEVLSAFADSEGVVCVHTPGGTAATVTLLGEYSEIPAAHAAVQAWCQANGRAMTGVQWEVYGHHSDDPATRRTDVFYQLA